MGSDEDTDPWLTVAEIAEELRLTTATIRVWISQGTLTAKRAGQRKWLVRRSELDRMLAERNSDVDEPRRGATHRARSGPKRVPDSVTAPGSRVWSAEETAGVDPEDFLAVAIHEWGAAVMMSQHAPPDAQFGGRLEFIARTSARIANALRATDSAGELEIVMNPEGWLSDELRPGANRPGPSRLWAAFDSRVEELKDAIGLDRDADVAPAFDRLADAILDIVDELPRYRGRYGEWLVHPREEPIDSPLGLDPGVS
jgi:excisionase family DNA binding protein